MIDTVVDKSSAKGEAIQHGGKSMRLWEVDTLRGIAIVLMVIFHFTWDLNFFGLYQTNILGTAWQSFARTIATMFIFTMGLSLTLSYNRETQRSGQASLFKKYLLRGGKIFGWGLVITVATFFFVGPRDFAIFGILHLLGFSIILAYPFLNFNKWVSLLAGLAVIGAGIYVAPLVVEFPWLIWLGIKQTGRTMVDYYPVLPWSGIALVGIFVGYLVYPQGQSRISWPDWGHLPPVRGLRFLGRHSLTIYLIHQPILIGIFFALGYGSF